MTMSPKTEMIKGFIEEVESYIPYDVTTLSASLKKSYSVLKSIIRGEDNSLSTSSMFNKFSPETTTPEIKEEISPFLCGFS